VIDRRTRELVRSRAADRCEYCRLRQRHFRLWKHQIEHIVPRKHGGSDALDNLALACVRCNRSKASNLTGIDPQTGRIEVLFDPRVDGWFDHFLIIDAEIVGVTPTGRATIAVLNMNDDARLRLRIDLLHNGELD
jgi:hypothetical protein